jgi:Ca2+:H+ antiporter
MSSEKRNNVLLSYFRQEIATAVAIATVGVVYLAGSSWFESLESAPVRSAALFVWIFAVMLASSFAVVRHADGLAEILGEPYGTLILTLAVITIEVAVIAAMMLHGEQNPTLARDTMLAVLMIVLNGIVGLCLLIGGLRHGEQDFNLQGARSFVSVLVTLATLSLILPNFTRSTPDGSLTPGQSAFFVTMTVLLYVTFLAIQTVRHRGFFVQPELSMEMSRSLHAGENEHHGKPASIMYHMLFLLVLLVCIVLLSKKLAVLTEYGMETLHAPAALGGILVAVLVLSPEGLAALQAASQNRLQRSVNICLGSALATIGLTVPAVLSISLVDEFHIILGLDYAHMVLLSLTLLLSVITFSGGRTNMLQGAVHIVVFTIYMMLVFSP